MSGLTTSLPPWFFCFSALPSDVGLLLKYYSSPHGCKMVLKIQTSHPDMICLEIEEGPSSSVGIFLIKLIFI